MGRPRRIGNVEPVPKVWLNEHEAAAYLGVGSKDTFLKWRNEGLLPFTCVPGTRRIIYSIADLDKLMLMEPVGPVTYVPLADRHKRLKL